MKNLQWLGFLFLGASCSSSPEDINPIRINQIGFYPGSVKEFVLADLEADSYQVVDENGTMKFEGVLMPQGSWESSGEKISRGDFTAFQAPGKYTIKIGENLSSFEFEIADRIYQEALIGSIKSFYFQRASMPIEEEFGGIYKREAGHADLNCPYHPSSGKSGGSLDSPKGWYDAGDYGKYIVNAALSVGQMLNLIELYPSALPDGSINIPESGNGVSDLLDEIRYELDWMLTMQDADGGVYHKLTAEGFSGFVMPVDYDLERVIIGKGTSSSLNFAAVMAQASRIFMSTDSLFARQCLEAAASAWDWSVDNPNVPYKNPDGVSTGQYGDDKFDDDFYWAAAELFITTAEKTYWQYLIKNNQDVTHQLTNSWKFFIRNNGFHSLLSNLDQIDSTYGVKLRSDHIALADDILTKMEQIPYHTSLDHFEWGSNSDVLNQALILCYAHYLSREPRYLGAAQLNLDYILGKNATGYSFLTGFGSKRAMNPHHRPSGADGIEEPVPGFIVGGPNQDQQDRRLVSYHYDAPAKSYEDVEASFASNEVCINWNAPAVFVLGYLEQTQ